MSLSNYDKKEKNIALLNDIYFAQDKKTIDQIKQLEIDKICTENRNSVLELIAIRHPELDCYGIQNPFDKQNIAYAIRDNSSSFARDQMITDKKQLLSEVEYRQYKKDKHLVEKELDKIAQSVDAADVISEYSNDYHSVYSNTEDCNTNNIDDDIKTDFSFDDDIESSDDDRIGQENKIVQAKSKVDGVERNHSPIKLTKRHSYIGEEKASHDQIYINSLMQFYSMLGISQDEIPLHPLNADGVVCEKIQEKFKTYLFDNYEEYKESILQINHSKSNNLNDDTVLTLSDQKQYIARGGSTGTEHNSLIYASTANNIEQLNRRIIFTPENIEERFFQICAQISSDKKTATGFIEEQSLNSHLRGLIETNYSGNLSRQINDLDTHDMSKELSYYINNNSCFLDIEIATPIIAKVIKKNILIVEQKKLGQFSYTFIRHQLNDKYIEYYDKLDQIKDDKDTIFIYHRDGNFKWLQKINNIQDDKKDVKTKKNIDLDPVIQLVNNKIYNIKNTSPDDNNCLIYAITKGNIGALTRKSLFTPGNIFDRLFQMGNTISTEGDKQEDTVAVLKATIRENYNNIALLEKIESSNDLVDISKQLSEYIISGRCFLDVNIAAPIIAKQLQKSISIISPDRHALNILSYNMIDNNGQTVNQGKLTKSQLDKIEEDYPNTVFIYNANGTHFEWLEEVTNDVQNAS